MEDLEKLNKEFRKKIIRLHGRSNTSHLGSSLSCIDIISVLYNRILRISDSERMNYMDKFILSKGHAAPALYVVLNYLGIINDKLINEYGEEGTTLFEHPERHNTPGVEVSTGSLGHGLSIGVGMAYSFKLDKKKNKIFVLMSDGECQEGSVWEAAMMASALKLDNIVVIIDYNNLQGFGQTENIQDNEKIRERFKASGWDYAEVDGHDILLLEKTLSNIPKSPNKPTVVIARTIKGKGVPSIENKLEWHYKSPNQQEVKEFTKEVERN